MYRLIFFIMISVPLIYGIVVKGKEIQYTVFYQDEVKQTIKDTVKKECLK